MATIIVPLSPQEAILRSTAFPYLAQVDGTNIPPLFLSYDKDQSAFWQLRVPGYLSGNNLTVTVDWYADTATSGNVVFGASIAAVTPNVDTQDMETDSLATESTTTTAHLGTTGQRLHRTSITVSNLDALAADDFVWLRVRRGSSGNGDTATGRIHVVSVHFAYTDGTVDNWVYVKLGSDFSTTSGTAVDVTGLAFTPAGNKTYEFSAMLMCRTATATVGPRPGIAWPTSNVTDGICTIEGASSATATVLAHGNFNAEVTCANTGLVNTTQSWPHHIRGMLVMGASPTGNLRVRLTSETAGTSVTIKAGSFLSYREI